MADEEPMIGEEEAQRARARLRDELGLGKERFSVPDFVRMIGDEVTRMRQAGHGDERILDLIEETTGTRLEPADLELASER